MIIKRLVLVLLRFYSHWISPLKLPSCRFYPSCSQYMRDAVEKHGVIKGFLLGGKRLFKCHPWHPGGVDFVP
jgi:putative membrane protein insertion efficiency factor